MTIALTPDVRCSQCDARSRCTDQGWLEHTDGRWSCPVCAFVYAVPPIHHVHPGSSADLINVDARGLDRLGRPNPRERTP